MRMRSPLFLPARGLLVTTAAAAVAVVMVQAQNSLPTPEENEAASKADAAMAALEKLYEKADAALADPPETAKEKAKSKTKPGNSAGEGDAKPATQTAEATGPGKNGPAKASKSGKDDGDGDDDKDSDSPEEGAAGGTLPPLLPGQRENGRGMDSLSRSRLDLMVPTGRSHRGVHFPMFRPVEVERGVVDPALGGIPGVAAPMDSLFESDLVTRLDVDHVQFDRAKWVQFEETPGPDGKAVPKMTLQIEKGVYDLKNEILMTNQPVRIENRQFVIEGDTMLHDRASNLTRLTGRVKMTIFNNDDEAEAGSGPEAAEAPAADAGSSAESPPPVPAAGSNPAPQRP